MTRILSRREVLTALAGVAALRAQGEPEVLFVCPMDPDIRSKQPGKCSKCGMALEPGIPNLLEYPVELRLRPAVLRPGQPVEIQISVERPGKGERVMKFRTVHEKLFHLFVVGEDLQYFVHDHPQLGRDGTFRLQTRFPKPGAYRLLCDFYPEGGTPQMIPRTVIVPGEHAEPAIPAPDLAPKRGANLEVELATEPAAPIAGQKTLLFFRLKPADGLEQYLGAWGHLLATSDDLVDMLHQHPAIADGSPQVQFNLIFPREAIYRMWVQFQRQGKVNTVAFTVPVSQLK